MTIINLDELKVLIDSRICEIVLQHKDIIDKISDKVIENITEKLLSRGIKERNNPPSTVELPIKRDNKIEGRDIREIINTNNTKNQLKLSEKLMTLATKNNGKKPYNIRRTINYIVEHPQEPEFVLPVLVDEIGVSSDLLRNHLVLLGFTYNENKRIWIRPEKWE